MAAFDDLPAELREALALAIDPARISIVALKRKLDEGVPVADLVEAISIADRKKELPK